NPREKEKGLALGIEGIAVDPAANRVYVLGPYERTAEFDLGQPTAGTLFALNADNLKSAVPITGTTKREINEEEEGVLAEFKTLKADGKNAGEALLKPTGIAVDPVTHDVVILGQVDDGKLVEGITEQQLHLALERVTSAGTLRPSPYVGPAGGEA